ncbi:MAG: 30S ribosomal protein THX [Kaistella sp.]
MGKGDQKSRRGKVTAGSYGKKRPRKSSSVKNIPVKVLDEDDKKASKVKVRKEVGYPTDKSENAEMPSESKPKAAAKPKAEKTDTKEDKPKAAKAKKTEE